MTGIETKMRKIETKTSGKWNKLPKKFLVRTKRKVSVLNCETKKSLNVFLLWLKFRFEFNDCYFT